MAIYKLKYDGRIPPDKLAAMALTFERQGIELVGARDFDTLWAEHLAYVWPRKGQPNLPIEVWQHASELIGVSHKGSATVYAHMIEALRRQKKLAYVLSRSDSGLPIPPYKYFQPKRGLGMGLEQTPYIQDVDKYGPKSKVIKTAGVMALSTQLEEGVNIRHLNTARGSRPPLGAVIEVIGKGYQGL